ncbi:AbrB family transcriptional regulator [Pseudooceanicola sp. 502str34]
MTFFRKTVLPTAFVIALGAVGGLLAKVAGLPLPYMLGALLATALVATTRPQTLPQGYRFPNDFRKIFIGLVGLSIGASITREVVASLPSAIYSFAALTLFVPLVHGINYTIFRKIGRYDHPTAFFAATPGGLMESILMGEGRGADIRLLTMQQFLRIITVVTLLPVGLSLWYGHPVGSASGISLSRAGADLHHFPEVILALTAGVLLSRVPHLPAGQLVGPMLVGMACTLTGLLVIEVPSYMISGAQVVIGASLGARFVGIRPAMLIKGMGLALTSVGSMLVVGGIMAMLLRPITGEHFDVLLISFAPGGVTEMALVALSLQVNPAFVTLHHIYRIVLTIIEMPLAWRFAEKRGLD